MVNSRDYEFQGLGFGTFGSPLINLLNLGFRNIVTIGVLSKSNFFGVVGT